MKRQLTDTDYQWSTMQITCSTGTDCTSAPSLKQQIHLT